MQGEESSERQQSAGQCSNEPHGAEGRSTGEQHDGLREELIEGEPVHPSVGIDIQKVYRIGAGFETLAALAFGLALDLELNGPDRMSRPITAGGRVDFTTS